MNAAALFSVFIEGPMLIADGRILSIIATDIIASCAYKQLVFLTTRKRP